MDFAAEIREELARSDVPVTVTPGAFLPAGQRIENVAVLGVGKNVIIDSCRNEAGRTFGAGAERDDVSGQVPGVTDAPGVGGRIYARTPGPAIGPEAGTTAAGDDIVVF